MKISQEKKQAAHKKLINTCKLWAVLGPLMLIYTAPPWLKSHSQIPVYHDECRSAQTVASPPLSSLPCYCETATAHLKSHYDHRGNHNVQDVLLNFPGGQTATMEVDGKTGIWWTNSQVDGSCLTEIWHGDITAVLKPGTRILSRQNPELLGSITLGLCNLILGALTLGIWVYLLIMWQQGHLSSGKKEATFSA